MLDDALLPDPYEGLLHSFKERIAGAQLRAVLAVNRELVLLYWQLGREILEQQRQHGWGARVVDRLARDLHRAFPDQKGFSPRNLKYMRAFAEAWPDEPFVQQVAAQIPWFHNCMLLEKVGDPERRVWYAQQTIVQGWSRNILVQQIDSGLYERQGRALTNFDRTLPPARSDLARQLLKDPYNFDFLSLGLNVQERDLEQALLRHIREFLLELGVGFAFVGSQYHLSVADQDYYLDMLFYHLKLRCYVVIDLKIGEFKPEDAGKMNFYLSAVDDLLRHTDDQPSIGVILCKSKSQVIVEYTLRDMRKPIGVAAYELTKALPEHLQLSLPTIEELEAAMNDPESDAAEDL
ncbi:MAG: PDDEXK nuclease domain-containing protein [Chloroflexota bacterium]|nr:PDDEXK nuclease domain-containing protein [Chloroflexota bacterium]